MKVAVLSLAHPDAELDAPGDASAGAAADAYVRVLRDMPGVEVVVAGADGPSGGPVRGAAAARWSGVAHADGWDEAFAWRPDAVVVTGGAARRRELVERAAGAGAHVLCPYPYAADEAGARAVADACEAAGVRLTLAVPVCFGPAFTAVRRAVAGGDAVGRLTTLHGTYDGGPTEDSSVGGGVLGVHAPALLAMADLVLGGDPASQVYAQANGVLGGYGSAVLVSVRYASGAVVALDLGLGAGPSSGNGVLGSGTSAGGPAMTFVGDRGSVEFTPVPRLLHGYDTATAAERWEPGGADPRAAMLEAFVASAAHGGRPGSDGPEGPDGAVGLRTMRIVQAAHESVRTGRPVDLAAAPAGRRA